VGFVDEHDRGVSHGAQSPDGRHVRQGYESSHVHDGSGGAAARQYSSAVEATAPARGAALAIEGQRSVAMAQEMARTVMYLADERVASQQQVAADSLTRAMQAMLQGDHMKNSNDRIVLSDDGTAIRTWRPEIKHLVNMKDKLYDGTPSGLKDFQTRWRIAPDGLLSLRPDASVPNAHLNSLIWSTFSTDVTETMDTKIVMVNGASHSLKMVGSFEEVMQALAEEYVDVALAQKRRTFKTVHTGSLGDGFVSADSGAEDYQHWLTKILQKARRLNITNDAIPELLFSKLDRDMQAMLVWNGVTEDTVTVDALRIHGIRYMESEQLKLNGSKQSGMKARVNVGSGDARLASDKDIISAVSANIRQLQAEHTRQMTVQQQPYAHTMAALTQQFQQGAQAMYANNNQLGYHNSASGIGGGGNFNSNGNSMSGSQSAVTAAAQQSNWTPGSHPFTPMHTDKPHKWHPCKNPQDLTNMGYIIRVPIDYPSTNPLIEPAPEPCKFCKEPYWRLHWSVCPKPPMCHYCSERTRLFLLDPVSCMNRPSQTDIMCLNTFMHHY
jgi:hypothetical protein